MSDILPRHVAWFSFILFVLLVVPASDLNAQCAPGYKPQEACTARDAHIKSCNATFDDTIIRLGITFLFSN